MKQLLLSVAAMATLSVATLHAQTFSSLRIHFDQPVIVVDNELPAGDYTIRMVETSGLDPLVLFQSDTGKSVIALAQRDLRRGDQAAPKTDVILDDEGSTEHVARIEIEGSAVDLVLQVPSSSSNTR
jgi:hypothetical protein